MTKKYLALFLTIAMLVSSFVSVPVFAEDVVTETPEVSTETIPMLTIATENFSTDDYNKSWGTQISSSYVDATAIAGTGWASNWLEKTADGNVASTTTNVKAYPAKGSSSDMALQSKADVVISRELEKTINLSGTGKYTFKLDVKSTEDVGTKRQPFALLIGDSLEAGYTVNSTDKLIVPYIKVGDGEAVAAETTTTLDGKDAGAFTTLELTVELNADGNDVVTLTATDSAKLVSTVTTTADVKGSSNTIYLDMYYAFIDNISIKGADYTAVNNTKALYDGIVAESVASESFATSQYSFAWSNTEVYKRYTDANVITGSGWASNWKTLIDGAVADFTTEKVELYQSKGASSDLAIRAKSAIPVARELLNDITFADSGVKYVLSLKNKSTSAGGGNTFSVKFGNVFEAGYEKKTINEAAAMVPYIKVNGTTVYAEDSVSPSGTGADAGAYNTIDIAVYPGINSDDVISATLTHANGTNTATVTTTANLTGTVEYLAFGLNYHYIDDITVTKYDRATLPEADDPNEDNTPYELDELAKETFATSQYTKGVWGTAGPVNNQYADGLTTTGTGWNGKWLEKDESGVFVATTNTYAQVAPINSDTAADVGIRYNNGAATLYRQLGTPVSFGNVNGKYVFGLNIKTLGAANADFKYILNDNITAGYKFVDGEAVPYITIGETTVNARNSISVASGSKTTVLSKFKVIVELNKTGEDKITVRLSTNGKNASVATTADLTGNCEYIGIDGSHIQFDNLYVNGLDYAIFPEADDPTEDNTPYELDELVKETFTTAQYGSGFDTKVGTVYNNLDTNGFTGTGWGSNWLMKDEDGAYVEADDSAATTNATDGNYASNGIGIRYYKDDGAAALYRKLGTPVSFDNADGKYIFGLDIKRYGNVYAEFKYVLNDDITVGYKFNAENKAVPFITIGDTTVNAKNSIGVQSGSTTELSKFKVIVELSKKGTDKITVRLSTNGMNASATTTADLTGSCEYIGIEGEKIFFDNLYINGLDYVIVPEEDDPAEDNTPYELDELVKEAFTTAQYGSGFDTKVGTVYNNLDTNGFTGTGWGSNWLMKGTDGAYVEADDSAATTNATDGNYASNGIGIRYYQDDGAAALYRKLGTPVSFDNADGKYIFGLDIKRYGNVYAEFKYVLNDDITVGYKFNAENKAVPFITIGDTTVNAKNSIGVQSGSTTELSKFKVIVELSKNGADKITVRLSTNGMNASATTTADLTGSCEYIGIEGEKIFFDNLYINGLDYAVFPEDDIANEDKLLYPADLSMIEEITTAQYGSGWDTVVGSSYTNLDANGLTGTGWGSNWLLKDTNGNIVSGTDKAATTYPTDGSAASNGIGIRFHADDGAAALYRKLGKTVKFDNIEGKYIFGLDIKTLGADSADFAYILNDNIKAGYKFVNGKAVPYITVGETTVNAKNNIDVKNGATTTPLSKFKVIVELNKTGEDKITVRLSTNGKNASATTTADLTGNCEYIGIDGAKIFFDNLYITGANYTAARKFAREAFTLSYVDADGQTQNAAGISEIPDDIRTVSVYIKVKNNGLTDYEDDGVTPKDNCATHMLTGFYYDGKLVMVKRYGDGVKVGQSTNTTHTFTVPTNNGWVENDEFDWSKVTIKSYVFAWNTFAPLCEAAVFEGDTAEAAEPKIIYVRANAADGGNGTEENPYNSINTAKFAVRGLNRAGTYPEDGVVIKLEGDFYTKDFADNSHPQEYLWLENGQDYGKAGAPLVFDGENKARIIGGIKLDLAKDFVGTENGDTINNANVKKYVAEKGALTAALPVTGSSTPSIEGMNKTPYFQVIFNGESMNLARWPNEGFDVVSTVYNEGNEASNDGFEFTSDRIATEGKLAQWSNDNIMIHGYWNVDYHDFGTPATVTANGLKGVYPPASGRELKQTLSAGQSGYNRRFYVENSPEDLDAPGEWYIDTTGENDVLYFWPTEATGEVIIGTTTDTIIKGVNSNYVTIKNLNVVGGRSGGIQMSGNGVTISGCTVNGVAGTGINVEGSYNSVIEKCNIYDIGAGGIVLVGGTRRGTTPKKGNNVARNNRVHDFAKVRFNYSYGLELGGYANIARNNEFYNAPSVAVTMTGWDLEFKNNKVHDVLKETSDMGAIYVGKSKARRGGQIINNHFYNLETTSNLDGGVDISAIFMDDISDGYTVSGNIFENIKGRAFRTNGGRDHTVTGNVFVNVRTNVAFKSQYGNTTQLGYILDDEIMTSGEYKNFTEYPHLAELVVPTEKTAENAKLDIMWPKYNVFKGNYTFDNVYGNAKVDFMLTGDCPDGKTIDAFMTNDCESEYEASTEIGAISGNNYSEYGINYNNIGVNN